MSVLVQQTQNYLNENHLEIAKTNIMRNSTIRNVIIPLAIIFLLAGCGEESSTLKLTANPTAVSENGSTTLEWSSGTDVTDCIATGDWSGSRDASGTEVITGIQTDSTFVLSCTGGNGPVSASVTVTVETTPPTSVSLSANPSSIPFNGTATLSWVSNANSCTASGDWSGTKSASGQETLTSLTASSTYSLSCTGQGGTAQDTASVTVEAAPPAVTVNLTADPSSISVNGSTNLSWHSSNAVSCMASGDWSGGKSTSGMESIGPLTQSATFILSCTGPGGTEEDAVSVTVDASSVTVNLTADPSSVPFNGSTELTWESTNSDECTASGNWAGSKGTSGTETIDSLTQDATFILSCTGVGGTVEDTVSVTVETMGVTVNLTADPASVAYNGSTILTWESTNADECSASGDWTGDKGVSGTETINTLTSDSQFIISCSNSAGTASDSVDVTVTSNGTGTALLSWTPPTENADGSALTDLAGYKIYYGTAPNSYTETITINNPGITSYQVENLTAADWYFVMTSLNSSGIESTYSEEVSKTIH